MVKTFEELVQSSSRLVKKDWSSVTEFSQELFSILSNNSGAGSSTFSMRKLNPVYAEAPKGTKALYPDTLDGFRDNSKVNFHGLVNPTKPNFPEVPPLSVKQKLGIIEPVVGVGGGGTSGRSVDIRISAAVAVGKVVSSEGLAHAVPGCVDVLVSYDGKESVTQKNLKVLNGNTSFKAPIGTDVVVFFSQYVFIPVWI